MFRSHDSIFRKVNKFNVKFRKVCELSYFDMVPQIKCVTKLIDLFATTRDIQGRI